MEAANQSVSERWIYPARWISLPRDEFDERKPAARRGQTRRRGCVRAPGRALPGRAAGARLPDGGLAARRRGRDAGGASARLARNRALRGPEFAAHLALHDHDQLLTAADRAPPEAGAADRVRPTRRPTRGGRQAAGRIGLGRALSG